MELSLGGPKLQFYYLAVCLMVMSSSGFFRNWLKPFFPDKHIIFIRHGTTEMNEALSLNPWGSKVFRDARLWDTVLSARGQDEAEKLNDQIKNGDVFATLKSPIELIVSSPLTRTLQTSELVFEGYNSSIPRIVLPLASERVYMSSDVGTPADILKEKFPAWNFSEITTTGAWWYVPSDSDNAGVEWRPPGDYACPGEPKEAFIARMKALKLWLDKRPEKVICLVTHWGVSKALTGIDLNNCEVKVLPLSTLRTDPLVKK